VAPASIPETSKTGNAPRVIAVIPSVLLTPVSLFLSRTGRARAAGGVVSMVIVALLLVHGLALPARSICWAS
jgi:predicted PurR-regulated permease PerM